MNGFVGMVAGGLSVATTFAIVEWIARSPTENRVFFLSLGRERTDADRARIRRVRIVNAIALVVAMIGVFARVDPLAKVILSTGATLASVSWLLAEMVLLVRSVRLETIPTRFMVSLDEAPRARDYVSMPLQLANVLAIVLPSVLFAGLLRLMPETVPMHWGVSGRPDAYGSPSQLWSLVLVMLFDLALLWGIVYGIAKERWALPEVGAARYRELSFQRRRWMVRMVEWVMLLVNASMAAAWIGVALAAIVGPEVIGPLMVLVVVLAVAGSIVPLVVYAPRLLRLSDQLRQIAGTEVLGTHASGWRWGGMIYYAPEDPALFVPKRLGIGQTLNMARPAAWVLLVVVLVVPLAITMLLAR
ncbi:MAG: DUF5808 domain-containing protein [Sandaracinaceae bacterium]